MRRERRGDRTDLVYELGKDVTVNVAADLSQEEPVAETELSAALRHLAVLKNNKNDQQTKSSLSLPAPSCWISDPG